MWSGLSRELFFLVGGMILAQLKTTLVGRGPGRKVHRRGGGARPGWGWAGSVIGTPRRGMVDRRTATLMYAGRNRRSATRRKVPLTKRAPA
jgi:hypothetical protein